MMVNGRHFEHSSVEYLEGEYLYNYRGRLYHIPKARKHDNEWAVNDICHTRNEAAQEKRACVTHKYTGRVDIIAQKSDKSACYRTEKG